MEELYIKQSTPGWPHPQDDPVSPPVWDKTGACWWHHWLTLVSVGTNQWKLFSANPCSCSCKGVRQLFSSPSSPKQITARKNWQIWNLRLSRNRARGGCVVCVGVWGLLTLSAARTSSLSFSTSTLSLSGINPQLINP